MSGVSFRQNPLFGPLVVACLCVLLVLVVVSGVFFQRRSAAAARERRYDALIMDAAQRHKVSPFLVKAVIWKESRFRHLAVGTKGEVGLMQITDAAVAEWQAGTGRRLPSRGVRFWPVLNIEIGTWYLSWASKHWLGYRSADALTLAEYNAGRGNVMKHGWVPDDPRAELQLEAISFPGTREYIRQVLLKWHEFEKEHRQRE